MNPDLQAIVNGISLDGAELRDMQLPELTLREGAIEGEPRFTLLETIREYALERLATEGELVDVRRRHAACFLAFAEHAEPLLRGAGQGAWLRRLSIEHDNLRIRYIGAVAFRLA